VVCYLHSYQTSTKTGAVIKQHLPEQRKESFFVTWLGVAQTGPWNKHDQHRTQVKNCLQAGDKAESEVNC